MIRKLLVVLAGSLMFAACSGTTNTNTNTNTATTPATSDVRTSPTLDPNAPVKFPFADFPAVATTAKPGDYVLCPAKSQLQRMSQPDAKNPSGVYYDVKMVKPGATESELEGFGTVKVPNGFLITIPAGQKAKVGDIVLTWWQSGSGMQRAIVVEAANPAAPKVRYLDRLADEDTQEQLKPDTFAKLTQPFQPGTSVACKGEYRLEHAQVVSVGGDKIFVSGWGGGLKVVKKADCASVPVKPSVKAGDKVKAMMFGSFDDATVVSVDEKLGKVIVKQEGKTEEKVIDFGDVMKP